MLTEKTGITRARSGGDPSFSLEADDMRPVS